NEWKHHLLQKDDYARIVIRDKNNNSFSLKNFVESFEKIVVESQYEDIHKEKQNDVFEINLIDMKETMDDNLWLSETSSKEDMEQISKEIKDISETLKRKKIQVEIKSIDVNPEKLKTQIKLYETLFKMKEKKVENLNEKETSTIKKQSKK
ncbi:MAG: hypothetical protein KAI55_04135, partial [Candidatus Aenigmarchaeota archaeon]|nr:hypothetical protein [Candidatus Aenigmarchaeota archaeon]